MTTNPSEALTNATAYLTARQANPDRPDPWEHHEGHERALTIDDLAAVVALATEAQANRSAPARPCEAIVAEFVYGPQRCGEPSTGEAMDAFFGSIHPVCDEHTPRINP